MCGSPIFEYEHIQGHQVTGDDPAEMTLLCKFHHGEKTHGRMPLAIVLKYNQAPFNMRRATGADHPLYYFGERFRVTFGNMDAPIELEDGYQMAALRVDGQPVIGARLVDGRPELELCLRDADNIPYLVVRKGQLRHTVRQWDIEWTAQTLVIRRALGDVMLRIKFQTPDEVVIERAEFWANGLLFRVGLASEYGGLELVNSNSSMSNFSLEGSDSAFNVGHGLNPPRRPGFRMAEGERWWGGMPAPFGSFRSL
jgi:trigger factor